MDWTARVLFSSRIRDFSLLHSIQAGCGAHPAFYPMDTRDCIPGDKAAGALS
jgi:hypothetical protein